MKILGERKIKNYSLQKKFSHSYGSRVKESWQNIRWADITDSSPWGRIQIPPFTHFCVLNIVYFSITWKFLIILSRCARHSLFYHFMSCFSVQTGMICFDIERWKVKPQKTPLWISQTSLFNSDACCTCQLKDLWEIKQAAQQRD